VAISVDVDGESADLEPAGPAALGGRFSHGRYGTRVGIHRLLEVLREHGMGATFFVPAWDAERSPGLVEAIAGAGHEIAAHGYQHEDHGQLGRAERSTLERAHTSLARLAGHAPVGWRAPRGKLTPRTLEHLVELGYRYDASFRADDLPHAIAAGDGQGLIEIPQFPFLNDTPFYAAFRPPSVVRQMWLEELEAIAHEGLLYALKLHPRGDTGSGRAVRAAVVDRICAEVRRRGDAWVATHAEVAAWWRRKIADGSTPARTLVVGAMGSVDSRS
jgi:peptidoglycan/xylan/chitin deacetylase (PgdA/CDA1 family)